MEKSSGCEFARIRIQVGSTLLHIGNEIAVHLDLKLLCMFGFYSLNAALNLKDYSLVRSLNAFEPNQHQIFHCTIIRDVDVRSFVFFFLAVSMLATNAWILILEQRMEHCLCNVFICWVCKETTKQQTNELISTLSYRVSSIRLLLHFDEFT